MYTRIAFYAGIALTVCLLGFIALVTSPIWVPAMFLSLPLIVFGYIIWKYTKVRIYSII
jgi:CHASE2 domain-containing sensor protein